MHKLTQTKYNWPTNLSLTNLRKNNQVKQKKNVHIFNWILYIFYEGKGTDLKEKGRRIFHNFCPYLLKGICMTPLIPISYNIAYHR